MKGDIIQAALQAGQSFFDRAQEIPVLDSPQPEEVRAHLQGNYSFAEPIAANELVEDVSRMLEKWAVHVVHPRYFGYFNPTPLREAISGDVLAAFFNPQLAVWSHAPAAVEMEQHVLSWIASKLGMPESAAAHFTSGGSEANQTAVIAALTSKIPEYGSKGLAGASSPPTIYHSAGAHDSFTKICHMTGVGREGLRIIPVDHKLRMDANALRTQIVKDIEQGSKPVMVVATAGTTAAGVLDPLTDIASICKEFDLWFHADAAWGGAAALSPTLRKHLDGIELADSITCDAHKWFNVTMGAGMFFSRHPQVIEEAFRVSTDYMPNLDQGSVDPFVTSAQWSRRFIGLKLFMAVAGLGEQGYSKMIDQQARVGNYMREQLTQAGWRHISESPLPVCCFTHPNFDDNPNALNLVLDHILKRARVWISKVQLDGTEALRACITSRLATEADVDILIEELSIAMSN